MEANLTGLKLTEKQLSDIREALYRKIIDGLRTHDQEIKMLPAYIHRPPQNLSGDAVVLDIGGTNIRAARVQLQKQETMLLKGPFVDTETMQMAKSGQVETREFFARQADLIEKACVEKEINLGYCFSYPTEILTDGNARLLKWTKGVNIPNVVGTLIGSKIRAALNEKGIKIIKLAILNDTVASLLAGTWMEPDCTHNIGLIVGTGTNMAGFFPVQRLTKLAPEDRTGWLATDDMAINLESGNFSPPHLTAYDDIMARAIPGDNPGSQRFEKAVSGEYLPRLFGKIVGRSRCLQLPDGFDPEDTDAHPGLIARLTDHPGLVGEAASILLNRSADLVAAALAGLIKAYDPIQKKVGIMAEGAMFWKTAGYPKRVKDTLSSLIAAGTAIKILGCASYVDSNLLGAATAVLSMKNHN